jgi:hypothetical protein
VMATAYAVLPALAVLAWTSARRGREGSDGDGDGGDGRRGASLSTLAIALLGPLAVTVAASQWPGDAALPWTGEGVLGGLVTGVLRPTTWIRIGWALEDVPMTWSAHRGLQVVAMVLVAGSAFWVRRRFGAAMAVFVLGVVLLTLVGYPDVASAGRRLTLAFPAAGVVGLGLAPRDRKVAVAVLGVSFVAMFTFYVLYLRSVGLPFW